MSNKKTKYTICLIGEDICEHWWRKVPAELITIIIIFLQFTLPFDGWQCLLIVLFFLLLLSSSSSLSLSRSSCFLCMCARCCCRQKSVTLYSIYAANRRNQHTHTRLARLRIELCSLQTQRNLFLSSLFIVSFSFVFSFFLRSYVMRVVYVY